MSPWFALPNALANAAIAQASTCGAAGATPGRSTSSISASPRRAVADAPRVAHAAAGRPRAAVRPPHRGRAGATATSPVAPFSASPPGYDFSPHLLRYAKSINLDLRISRAATLDDAVPGDDGEALVVCLQFRLGHAAAEERREVLRKARGLNPELVVLSELDSGVGVVGGDGGSAAGEFAARLELLWRFLESTSAAFKGRTWRSGGCWRPRPARSSRRRTSPPLGKGGRVEGAHGGGGVRGGAVRRGGGGVRQVAAPQVRQRVGDVSAVAGGRRGGAAVEGAAGVLLLAVAAGGVADEQVTWPWESDVTGLI